MVTTLYVPSVDELVAVERLAETAVRSNLVKVKNVADAALIILYGAALGLNPIVALRTIYVANGVPTCSGEMLLALIRRSGLAAEIRIPPADEVQKEGAARVYMRRSDASASEYTAVYTLEDAKRAGLLDKDNWKRYPAQMLMWRAVSMCAKALFPDVVAGLYTVEEIAPDVIVSDSGDPISDVPAFEPGLSPQLASPPEPAPASAPASASASAPAAAERVEASTPDLRGSARANLLTAPAKRITPTPSPSDAPAGDGALDDGLISMPVSYVDVKVGSNEKRYIETDGGAIAYTRDPFRKAGIGCDHWEAGNRYFVTARVYCEQKGDRLLIKRVENTF